MCIRDSSNNIRSTALNPEQSLVREQRVYLMRTVLTKLSDKYRQMIELRYFEELSYDEIAVKLNIPLGTVKAQLFRAKEILHNILLSPGAQAYLEVNVNRTKRAIKAKKAKKATIAMAS